MNQLLNLFLCAILLVSFQSNSQNTRGVQIPNSETIKICEPCLDAFKNRPKEARFAIHRDDRHTLYFEISETKWIKTVFENSKDGIMIDIVTKDRYDCSQENLKETVYGLRGVTLPIVSGKKIISGLKKQEDGSYRVKIGVVPVELREKDVEFNMYFIKDNFFCYIHSVYNIEYAQLDMLDPGMYLDDLTYVSDFKKPVEEKGFKVKYKKMKFVIPFEKNKSEYSQEDIKPMYDSLQLTKFDIKRIKIKAFSSVEGTTERNVELQESRANSIVQALQAFQKPTINNEIEAQENWVEFYNDIQNTEYASFGDLNKQQIKAKLHGATSQSLEVYLKNHRKAIIELDLEKKDPYKKMASDQLINQFLQEVNQKNIEEANIIHKVLFQRIKSSVLSPDNVKKLNVPNTKEFSDITIKNISIEHLLDVRKGMIVNNKLLELEKKYPKNKKIKYNLVAIKFVIWRNNWAEVNPTQFKTQINSLKYYGISDLLIERLLINYNIIQSRKYLIKGDYKRKDYCVKNIYNSYNKIEVKDEDYLGLAQYFVTYARYDYALEVLKDRVKELTVDEDLLFYYLNMTIVKKEQTKTKEYRTIMLNALAQNKKRFCSLFNQYKKDGGVTFQLLENEYLRGTYCENCNE